VVIKNNLSGETITHPANYLVIKIGFAANSELFSGQVKTTGNGQIIVDQFCQTNIDGIFAGGDLVAPECLGIARSVGHGLIAARSICKYLINYPD
jgi:thioredoxin reductase